MCIRPDNLLPIYPCCPGACPLHVIVRLPALSSSIHIISHGRWAKPVWDGFRGPRL